MSTTSNTRVHLFWLAFASLLLLSFLSRFPNLNHASIKPLDEVFHAIVARNLMAHPLTPTLNNHGFISAKPAEWQNGNTWLHKPPMALWQIAACFKVLGVSTFALRLPSAILATAAVAFTGLIARHLFDSTAALIAMSLQAFNPVIEMLVHGYVFSDHVDISLLFWTELSIWLLLRTQQSGDRRYAVFCGLAQGAAFLSKTFPALIVIAMAVGMCSVSSGTGTRRHFSWKNLFWIALATFCVAGPWNLYAAIRWPHEFFAENFGILAHLTQNVEGWEAPWDRLLVDYGWRVFHVFYPAVIATSMIAIFVAIRHRDRRVAFVLAWAAMTLVPNLLATSKPMTSTLVGWPACWILLGWGAREALRGSAGPLLAWTAATLLPIGLGLGAMPAEGWGYPQNYSFGSILLSYWKPVALGIAAGAFGLAFIHLKWRKFWPSVIVLGSLLICFTLPTHAGSRHGYAADFRRVSKIQAATPDNSALIAFASRLPTQAVLLIAERTKLENKLIAFGCDRDCYSLIDLRWQDSAEKIISRGGLAYVVTEQPIDLPVVWRDSTSSRLVYACSPASVAGASGVSRRD